jgi:helix-turn-helix, Psq domain.
MNKRGTMIDPEEDSRYIQFTPEQLQALADLYVKEGWSTRKLSRRYGVSACTVRRRLLSLGVTLRNVGQNNVVTPKVIETARRMLAQKKRWRAVAEATGVRADSIMCAMRRERQRKAAQ